MHSPVSYVLRSWSHAFLTTNLHIVESNITNMTVVDSVSGTADTLLSNVNSYAASHRDGVIALLLFTGVIIAFTGRSMLRPTVFLLGFIPASAVITTVGLALADNQTNHVSIIRAISLILALLFGTLVGVILLRLLFHLATFVLCAGFGAVLVFVAHLLLLEPAMGPNAQFILFAAAILAALVSGLLSVSYPETGIIMGTSFDGSALAVYSLSRFLGHRPSFLSQTVSGVDITPWWAFGYGAATVLLGVFGAMTQRQVALADSIIAKAAEKKLKSNSTSSAPDRTNSDNTFLGGDDATLLTVEPPRTPPFMKSGVDNSPAGTSLYGATDNDDGQYSVIHNLGADPLGPSIDPYHHDREGSGPL